VPGSGLNVSSSHGLERVIEELGKEASGRLSQSPLIDDTDTTLGLLCRCSGLLLQLPGGGLCCFSGNLSGVCGIADGACVSLEIAEAAWILACSRFCLLLCRSGALFSSILPCFLGFRRSLVGLLLDLLRSFLGSLKSALASSPDLVHDIEGLRHFGKQNGHLSAEVVR